jgi:hypothetical protein
VTLEMIREVEAEREQALQTQDDTASRTTRLCVESEASATISPPF